MSRTGWSPGTVPYGADQTVYLVIDRLSSGSVYRETEVERTDLETMIDDFLTGQFNDPVRVVAFIASQAGALSAIQRAIGIGRTTPHSTPNRSASQGHRSRPRYIGGGTARGHPRRACHNSRQRVSAESDSGYRLCVGIL